MSEIQQMVYRSQFNAGGLDQPLEVLRAIVKISIANNVASGITGYLLFDGIHFLQVLEGGQQEVWETFARIAPDDRHSHVEILHTGIVSTRGFPRWNMGGYFRDERDREIFEGYGAPACRIAAVPAERAVALISDLSARRKTIFL